MAVIVEKMTKEDQYKMYMKLKKKELVEMLIECNSTLDAIGDINKLKIGYMLMNNKTNIEETTIGETVTFICECNSLEHQLTFWYNREDKELHTMTHLITYRNFFKRLWCGLKYVFGYKSRFGDWDFMIFKEGDVKKLYKFLSKINA